MFRWPLALTPLSLGSHGTTRDTMLEITPRGAIFTLAALSHVGHPSHLAVIDAYLKGQMRLSGSAGIGEDSRLVTSALAGPLVAAHELGIERLGLADLILLPVLLPLSAQLGAHRGDLTPQPPLPRTAGPLGYAGSPRRRGEGEQAREHDDGLTRTPESPRFLLRTPETPEHWLWVRAAERFEVAGCIGTPNPGLGSHWHDAVIQLPERPTLCTQVPPSGGLPPIDAELRAPTETLLPSPELVDALRALGLARFARASARLQTTADAAIREIEATVGTVTPLARADLQQERRTASVTTSLPPVSDPMALAGALAAPLSRRQPVETAFQFQGTDILVSLTPDLDGYQTLCLLPPATPPAAATLFELMRAAAWKVIEALMGRPLAEYRTEPIALRLVGAHGRTTTLEIGASVVVVRNQIVFTAWVGSDGRVMLKMFPPGGMPTP